MRYMLTVRDAVGGALARDLADIQQQYDPRGDSTESEAYSVARPGERGVSYEEVRLHQEV